MKADWLIKIITTSYLVVIATSHYVRYSGDQVWRILPEGKSHVDLLDSLSRDRLSKINIWKFPQNVGQPVDLQIPFDETERIRQQLQYHGVDYNVLSYNVQDLIDNERTKLIKRSVATGIIDFDYGNYHPAEEIEQWIDFAVNDFDYVSKFQIGVTYEGRPINALKISKSGQTKPAIYVDSLIHCREWIATASTIYMFKEMLTNQSYAWMTEELDWYFIPMINVDGYIYTWTTDRLWRKTRSGQASLRCDGVDSNRNFDDHWEGPTGSSEEPCSAIYRGPIPESEPETRHLARFISARNDTIKAVVTMHSYAQLILYPYNFDTGEYPKNNDEQNKTAEAMSKAMYDVNGIKYNWGPGADTLAVASGVTTDWTQAKANIRISYTIELRDTGQYGFILPSDQIIPTAQELLAGMVVLANHVNETKTSP